MQHTLFKIYKTNKEKAFTLIEVVVAMAVLAIGLLSVVALSSKSYAAISLQKNKLIAINLTREEVELVRNVRNDNWLYTGTSDCNKNGIITNCNKATTGNDGQIYEDQIGEAHKDCDWRCGDEKSVLPSQPTFILDNKLKDLDYNGNADYTGPASDCTAQTNGGTPLYIDPSTGFYRHKIGTETLTPTSFRRLIVINRTADANGDGKLNNNIQVKVTVCWQDRGRSNSVSTEEHLFNWKK